MNTASCVPILMSLIILVHTEIINNAGKKNSTLVMLHVMFRHGARTPCLEEIYPNDPYSNAFHTMGYGELTNAGKLEEYEIGKALRSQYDRFLGRYSPDVILATSTNVNRTKISLQLVLASLYPPVKDDMWNSALNWQPIPFNYESTNKDHILTDPADNCPNYLAAYENNRAINSLKLYNNNVQLYKYLSKYTGLNVTIPDNVYQLYFDLKAEESMGFKLPNWTAPVWPKNITMGAVEEYYLQAGTPYLKKMTAGFFVKKIVADIKAKMEGRLLPANRKVFLYSAHENNLASLLILLNVFYPHVPPFGSYVTFEVHNFQNVYGIKIFYQDYTTTNGPRLLTLPGCHEFCPVDKFTALFEEYFPTSEDLCGNE